MKRHLHCTILGLAAVVGISAQANEDRAGASTTGLAPEDQLVSDLATGSCNDAKRALLTYLEEIEARYTHPLFGGAVYWGDRTVALERLAMISHHSGDDAASAYYAELAQSACAQAQWKRCDSEAMGVS